MNVVIACGGTGGHLFPGLAVAEVLRLRGHQVLIFISEKEIDTLAVRDYVDLFRIERLASIGMPRVFSPAMFGFLRGALGSVARCRQLYADFKPDAVLGMGGFTSTAPIFAGRRLGLPTFIHESNAIPGKANRLNARIARTVLLGFAECAKYFRAATRCQVTGTPIRASLRVKTDRPQALASFGFQPGNQKKTLLIMGGSQGARGINQAALGAATEWREQLRIIHFTGRDGEDEVRGGYRRIGVEAHVAAFCHEMQEAYTAADFAVARSGAASLCELAYFGLPSLLIPYPHAAEDHQTFNGRIFEQAGAAFMMQESLATGPALAKVVLDALVSPHKLSEMVGKARRLAPADAAVLVVEAIEKGGQR